MLKPIDNLDSIRLGVSLSHSHEWDDFYSEAQPSVETAGRIVCLNYNGELDGIKIDQLESLDGYLYKSKYKRWSPGCTIEIYDSDNNLISSSDYREYPRNGYIVFSSKKEGNCLMKIIPSNIFRTGTKIFSGYYSKNPKIYGMGYLYTTRQ